MLLGFLLMWGTFSSCSDKVRGCMDPSGANFNAEAERSGSCEYQRTFYVNDSLQGWVDIWVAQDTSLTSPLVYEGRVTGVHEGAIPDCNISNGTVQVIRRTGEHLVEYETQTGFNAFVTVIWRDDGCRLFLVE